MEDAQLMDFMAQYTPEVQELIFKVRAMLERELPDAREFVDIPSRIIAYGYSPKYKDLVCAIAPYASYINLIFSTGTRLSDPLKILAGTGKRARHVKIQSMNDVEMSGIADLVHEADLLTRGS